MNLKYTPEYAIQLLSERGFTLLSEFESYRGDMHFVDKDGYEYCTSLAVVITGKKTKRFHPQNPFTIKNIKLHLINEGLSVELLSENYTNSRTNMTWKCTCGEIFDRRLFEVLYGQTVCLDCVKKKRLSYVHKDYTDEIIAHCKKINCTLLTNERVIRNNQRFNFECNTNPEHGILSSTYKDLVYKDRKCAKCSAIEQGERFRNIDDNFYKRLVEEKGFIYVGFEHEYYKTAKIKYICPFHIEKGIQKMAVANAKNSKGKCKYCIGREKTQKEFQQLLDEKNSMLTIINFDNYPKEIEVKCNVCDSVRISKVSYLRCGTRCPHCTKSMFEIETEKILNSLGLDYIFQHRFTDCKNKRPLPFDYYIENKNILIEVDGEGHYRPIKRESAWDDDDVKRNFEEIKKNDKIKSTYCKKHKINLIRIPYFERDNLENYLTKKLNELGVV